MPVLAVEVAPRDQALDHHLLTLDEDHLMNTLRSNWKRLTFLRSACYRRKGGRNGTPSKFYSSRNGSLYHTGLARGACAFVGFKESGCFVFVETSLR